jgi:hypothetical protein
MTTRTQFTGQCQCGEIRYQVTGTPATLFVCHCTECQRQSSSAFGMALWIRNGTIKLLSGELKKWIRNTPLGKQMECSFCPTCGTRIFHKILEQNEYFSIKPGTLDDTSWLRPAGHIWTHKAQPWVNLDNTTLKYTGNPKTFPDLFQHGKKWMCVIHDEL